MEQNYLFIVALVLGFYAAWNIGANDVANAMGTSVGSKALTLRRAVILASFFEFFGAVLFGSNVSETLQSGIVNPQIFADNPMIFVRGMLAALLGTGLWLQFASYCGLPVSTTHAIVGGIVGFGAVIGGVNAVYWDRVFQIGLSWIASPLLGAACAFLLFSLIRRHIFYKESPLEETKKLLPYIVGAVVMVLLLSSTYQVILPKASTHSKILLSFAGSIVAGISAHYWTRRLQVPVAVKVSGIDPPTLAALQQAQEKLTQAQKSLYGSDYLNLADIIEDLTRFCEGVEKNHRPFAKNPELVLVEKIFGGLQISSACLMAFAHGSNDVANAIGPMAAVISTILHEPIASGGFPVWALTIGGLGIVIGLATWGWRVIETIGKRITELTPSRGFSAEFGAAVTILLASRMGYPISTTHTIVGAVFGVGFARGIGTLNLKTIRDILLSWVVTLPAGAALSILCYYLLLGIV
jgi:inorganic phosphate transporter, PiT family